MLILKTALSGSQFRLLSNSSLLRNRFTRESLRNRLYKQNIKDLTKQKDFSQHGSRAGPFQPPPYVSDVIPVRPASDLMKALGFTVAVTGGTFAIAVVSDLERMKSKAQSMFVDTAQFFKASFTSTTGNKSEEFTWKQLSDGDKTAFVLVALNLAVFACWKVRGLQPMMWRYFSNSFASRSLCSPMVLSAFSHSSLIHLALNMYVVYSFTNVAIDKFLGPDQFWAFYISAAAASSLLSLAHKSVIRSPVRALGASGAILGLLGYVCMKIPDARLKIVFVPNFDFSAQSAIYGILLFDLAGLLFRFKLFDHAAHLGGVLFGVFYAKYGEHLIWDQYGGIIESLYRSVKNE